MQISILCTEGELKPLMDYFKKFHKKEEYIFINTSKNTPLECESRQNFILGNIKSGMTQSGIYSSLRRKGFPSHYKTFQRDIIDLEKEGKIKSKIISKGRRSKLLFLK